MIAVNFLLVLGTDEEADRSQLSIIFYHLHPDLSNINNESEIVTRGTIIDGP